MRSKSMRREPKKLGILTEHGWLIALAVAVGLMLGLVGPTSAQFFNFGGFQQQQQQRSSGHNAVAAVSVVAGLVTTRLRRSNSKRRSLGGMGGKRQRLCARIFPRRRRPRNAALYRSATF